jgi:hypothetical protein
MRKLAVLSVSALVLGFVQGGGPAMAQTQAAPSETTVQTPERSVQSDGRSRPGDVKIERDWRAHGGENDRTGSVKTEENHETVGRDWRAHPDNRDR